MSELREHPADPWRMHPSLKRNAAAWHPAEHLPHGFRRRAQSLLQDNRARFIQHAVPARPIPQIQSDRQFLFEEILALLRRYSANLLHCRSPFYLCLEHVDNLGAYTASRPETGLSSHLISSMDVKHPRKCMAFRSRLVILRSPHRAANMQGTML
jgi:hypothetical protein